MKFTQKFTVFFLLLTTHLTFGQIATSYTISFENAVHHEALITATFTNLEAGEFEFRMARTSPGRYALHEFVKNIYKVKVTDAEGNDLPTTRPDVYSWKVPAHNGTVVVRYTLFANHGDGTYAQIDESHAHLNIPATFMYAPSLSEQEIRVLFELREDLNWKIATQLKQIEGNLYAAPNFHYFMDSPVELSDHSVRSFEIDGQHVKFALHKDITDEAFDAYFEKVKKIVLQQKAIFGTLPNYDYGAYTFLGCYVPQVAGDAMEHRNSTFLTNSSASSEFLSAVSHEFFHGWNVERIRPQSLEPFDFSKTNISGELWFAEGFTNYYGDLSLVRSGLISDEEYLKIQVGGFNYVWTSTGRALFNPIEMSYKAPFQDAATSIDEQNTKNTFISYYYYGQFIAMALDLSLRQKGLDLDGYMRRVWESHGATEQPYTNNDLLNILNTYAGEAFGTTFFNAYIYGNQMPDFKALFASVGIQLAVDENKVNFGTYVYKQQIGDYPPFDSSAYNAGLTKGDKILKIGTYEMTKTSNFNELLGNFKPGDTVSIAFERFGILQETTAVLQKNNRYSLSYSETIDAEILKNRQDWLSEK